jgi:uncharacterized membrane protein
VSELDDTDPLVALVTAAVLGLGLLAMALDASGFWLVWVVGFAVVVPAITWLREGQGNVRDDDALATLRERYARGDLSEAAFEAKVETLLETETPESARERTGRETEREAET